MRGEQMPLTGRMLAPSLAGSRTSGSIEVVGTDSRGVSTAEAVSVDVATPPVGAGSLMMGCVLTLSAGALLDTGCVSRLPIDLRPRLAAPNSWLSAECRREVDESPARQYLRTLWTAITADASAEFIVADVVLVLVSSQRIAINVRREPGGSNTVILTDALAYAVNVYTRAWTAFHHEVAIPTLGSSEREAAARRSALDLAWWYRHTGRTRPESLVLAAEAEDVAASHAAVAMIFLLVHEIGHVVTGHLEADRSATRCVDVAVAHADEYAADLFAASWLAANPPATTRTGESLRVLFELLELVAAGTPGDEITHPLAMRRLLALLSTLDAGEHNRVLRALTEDPEDFWLLRP